MAKIKPEDLVEEVIQKYPQTVKIFMDFDFPCLICGEPVWGTIKENADRSGITGEKFEKMMEAVNKAVESE